MSGCAAAKPGGRLPLTKPGSPYGKPGRQVAADKAGLAMRHDRECTGGIQ